MMKHLYQDAVITKHIVLLLLCKITINCNTDTTHEVLKESERPKSNENAIHKVRRDAESMYLKGDCLLSRKRSVSIAYAQMYTLHWTRPRGRSLPSRAQGE